MEMPGRTFVLGAGYRYGFNGQEKDTEVYGNTSLYTAMHWEYDARIGRRWNRDPVVKYFESPYATFANNPIWFADPLGADTIKFTQSSWSAPSPKSGLDNVQFKPLGGVKNSINVKVAEGKDVFLYTRTHTAYDEEGNVTTTTSTQQFYPVEDHKNGITETPYFFGLLSYKDNDQLTLAKLAPTELLDYLIDKSVGYDRLAYRGTKVLQSSYSLFTKLQTVTEIGYTIGSGAGLMRGTIARSNFVNVRINSAQVYAQNVAKSRHNIHFNGKRMDLKGRHPNSSGHFNKVTKEQFEYPHVYDSAYPGGVRSATSQDWLEIYDLFIKK